VYEVYEFLKKFDVQDCGSNEVAAVYQSSPFYKCILDCSYSKIQYVG